MKLASVLLIATCLSGCLGAGSTDTGNNPAPTDAGPALCKDGTPPPCTIRD